MKIWFNDASSVVIENDDEQVTIPKDIALHLMILGARTQKNNYRDDDAGVYFYYPDFLAALKAEAER